MNKKTLRLAVISLMAALSYIAFTFFQIKIPTPAGYTSFHLGNTFCILGALLLGGLPGGLAGAIGMAIGDLFDPAYVLYAPKTIVLKLGIGLVCGFVAYEIMHIEKKEGKELVKAVIISAIAGMAFNVLGEPIFSYFYTSVVLGAPEKATKALASWNAITTSTNALLSVIFGSSIYLALYPKLKNNGIINKLRK